MAHPVAIGVLRGLPVGGPLIGFVRCLGRARPQEEAGHNVPHIGLWTHTTGSQLFISCRTRWLSSTVQVTTVHQCHPPAPQPADAIMRTAIHVF